MPDYLVLGHMTRDVLPDGTTAPGGTSFYAALTAHRLGYRAALVSAPATLPADWPASIRQATLSEAESVVFENCYTPAGRTQLLHSTSAAIGLDDIPSAWCAAPIVHLGPILGEVGEALARAFPHALLGITPQGLMRSWTGTLPAPLRYRPWRPSRAFLEHLDAIILSIEDVRGDESIAEDYARYCRLVVLTRGASGATVLIGERRHDIPAAPAIEHDPTGAGDVFAASFLVRLHETADPLAAAQFAAQVAAFSIEGPGATNIPPRAVVDAALLAPRTQIESP